MHENYCFNQLYHIGRNEIQSYTSMDSIDRLEKACQESIKAIEDIRQQLYNQVQKMQNMTTIKTIQVDRRKRYKGNVEISVHVRESRQLEDYTYNQGVFGTMQRFNGKQKKQALQYAEELRSKHGVNQIVKTNWI